jgi:protein involved in polysaccharide export with SLBB domain
MKSYKNILYYRQMLAYTFVFMYLLCIAGCFPELSTTEQLQEFRAAGPITPQVDVNRLLNAKMHTGYYRVIPGDIIELQMPAVLRVVSSELTQWFAPASGHDDVEPYYFRLNDAGFISLPIIGKISITGLTLTEIEILIVNSYYPKYVEKLPSVICKVKEYQTQNITVLGGVVRPGLYRLSSEEMSLVAALMKAGGIINEGAALITVEHSDNSSDLKTESVSQPNLSLSRVNKRPTDSIGDDIRQIVRSLTIVKSSDIRSEASEPVSARAQPKKVDLAPIVLPVKNLNIPFADVVLLDGDTIRVEKLNPEVFTVLGPVTKPGVFPYPPDVRYNLMQALAFAGGPDLVLNPRYITVYRQDAAGQIVTATFHIDPKNMADASALMIKPGDVISVEMTPDVRTKMILREMLDVRLNYNLKELIE